MYICRPFRKAASGVEEFGLDRSHAGFRTCRSGVSFGLGVDDFSFSVSGLGHSARTGIGLNSAGAVLLGLFLRRVRPKEPNKDWDS